MTPVHEIQQVVADTFGIQAEDMTSPSRYWKHSHPRQVAMMLARKCTNYSLPRIGRLFGNRDHTTVIHAIRSVEQRRKNDWRLASSIRFLERRLGIEAERPAAIASDPCPRCGARADVECGHSKQRLGTVFSA